MKPKLILIARVSDVEQRQALPAQKLRLQDYATQKGYTPKEYDYHEFDESAYKDDRQKFAVLIENHVQTLKDPAILVFDKIDRFTRDASQREVQIISKLVDKGLIELHFPSDNLYITQHSPAADKFRLGIGMLLAKYYSDASRDNVKRRFAQMRHDGFWTHKAPVGYKNVRTEDSSGRIVKDIVVDDTRAHYIVKAFELRAQGVPYAVIAKELAAAGFRSNSKQAKVPGKQYIEKILRKEFYCGFIEYNGELFEHKYPRLISRALFNLVQQIRDERNRSGRTKYDSKDFSLKKIVRCGKCGRCVSLYTARHKSYMRCANPECDNKNTAVSLVMDGILEDMGLVTMPVEWMDGVVSELRKRHDDQQSYHSASIAKTREEYDKLTKKLEALLEVRLEGSITKELYDKTAKDIERRQQELNERLKMLTNDNVGFHITASYLLDLAQRAEALFNESDPALQQKLLEYLLSNIELNDKKLSYVMNNPFRAIVEAKKKRPEGANSKLWWSIRDSNP